MSPFPRIRITSAGSGGDRKLQLRLDLLILLMVAQIGLSILILCARPSGDRPAEVAEVTADSLSEEAAPTTIPIEETQPPVETVAETPSTTQPAAPAADWSQVKIDVLNGCGVAGLAKKAQDWMETKGFRVRDTDNADRHDYPRSFIQLREGDRAPAEALAKAIGISPSRIVDARSPKKKEAVHLSLVIGLDYKELAFVRR